MEENNTKKTASKKKKSSVQQFYDKHMAEFRKIIWPSRQTLMKETVTVICISLIVGIIIWGYDEAFEYLYQTLVSLVK